MKQRRWGAVDVLFWLGGGLVSLGVGLWALPAAGLVAAGTFCLLGAYLSDGASRRDKGGDSGA